MNLNDLDLTLEQIRTMRQMRPANAQELIIEKQREDRSLIVSRYGQYAEIFPDGFYVPDRPLFH